MAWVFPPAFQRTYDARREAYREFEERISALAQPGELILRFNDGSFSSLTTQPDAFLDGVHMTRSAATEVARILDQRIRDGSPGAQQTSLSMSRKTSGTESGVAALSLP